MRSMLHAELMVGVTRYSLSPVHIIGVAVKRSRILRQGRGTLTRDTLDVFVVSKSVQAPEPHGLTIDEILLRSSEVRCHDDPTILAMIFRLLFGEQILTGRSNTS